MDDLIYITVGHGILPVCRVILNGCIQIHVASGEKSLAALAGE